MERESNKKRVKRQWRRKEKREKVLKVSERGELRLQLKNNEYLSMISLSFNGVRDNKYRRRDREMESYHHQHLLT